VPLTSPAIYSSSETRPNAQPTTAKDDLRERPHTAVPAGARQYEAQLEGACKQVRRCTYDDGAFGRIVDQRDQVAADFHLSIQGHAKAAAVAWTAVRRAGELPRRG
jgi:hypothetical protein